MEKTELIQQLRAKVGEDDVRIISDKTFDGIAESVLPLFADDDKVTDETWSLPVAALKEFAGQKRHDDKNFAEKYKQDFSEQHEKDVAKRIKEAEEKALADYLKKQEPSKKTDEEGDDDLNKRVQEAVAAAMASLTGDEGSLTKLTKTVETFITTQGEREKSARKAKVKSDLKQHLVGLKANNESCIEDALDDIDYGDSPTFDGLKETAVKAYEKRYKRYYGDGGKPFGGDGSFEGGGSSFIKDRIKQLEEENKQSQNYAEELSKGFTA